MANRKRPLGITLLAIPFLCIGCLGTLVFPLVFAGHTTKALNSLAAAQIHSEFLRTVLAYFVTLVWFGGYVLYAFIGFGLWKLRKWSWFAVVTVTWISVAMSIVAGLIAAVLLNQPLIVIPIEVGLSLPLGGILWYFYRPYIRSAFEAPVGGPENLEIRSAPPPFPTKPRTWLKFASVAVFGFALFGGSLLLAVEHFIRTSTIYAMTLKQAQKSPCAIQRMGTPIESKGMASGEMSESSTEGKAELVIPVRGPKGNAELQVSATKDTGTWHIVSLILITNGEQIQLGPAGGDSDCRYASIAPE